jgi:anthranilate phosphoribosyltransferase
LAPTQQTFAALLAGQRLDAAGARALFDEIMDGKVAPALLAACITAIAVRGETVDELVGAAAAMRARATAVRPPADVQAIDTCGTGGDGQPTFNVSSAVAIVAAAAGATVAKHGNRSNSRPSGSIEGLTALGVNVDAEVPVLERCLRDCRVAFLNAPRLHPAMKHAAEVRRALGVRTIFNLLGPLANPAGVRRQLIGVSRPAHVELVIEALRRLGAERAIVVHGHNGLCDVSLAGPTRVGRWDGREVTFHEVDARTAGLSPAPLQALFIDSPNASAEMIEGILRGEAGPPRDAVLLNTAAALWVAGEADDWREGAAHAAAAIDDGRALDTLQRWRDTSHGRC